MREIKDKTKYYPKVLIVGRSVWTEEISTLANIFGQYNTDNLSYIYIESAKPTTKLCHDFFHISEIALIKKIFKRKIKTGGRVLSNQDVASTINKEYQNTEQKIMSFVRKHRSYLFLFLRELLWSFNGWKTKDLDDFIEEVNPDVVFLLGDPLPLMNRLQNYIIEKSKKPAAIFLMDDIYTYKSSVGMLSKLYKSILRKHSKQTIMNCSVHFAISPKLKNEYDQIFNIDNVLLTKGIDFSQDKTQLEVPLNHPIRIVYTGTLIYGRYKSLAALATALQEINKSIIKAQLFIYTQDEMTPKLRKILAIENSSFLMGRVTFQEALEIQTKADILLFVESLDRKHKNIARLSFSTKITDYFHSGKCIFAIGSKDIAPIEYLIQKNAAVVATNSLEIKIILNNLLQNPLKIKEYGKKAYQCGLKHHNNIDIQNVIYKGMNNCSLKIQKKP